MSILDIILIICFIPAIINGIRKGFISQVLSIVSLIGGVWLAFEFSSTVSEWLGQYIQTSANILHIASFAIIMIGVFIAIGLICRLLEGILNIVMLGWLNKLLGIAFAFLKTALIIGLIIMLFNSLNNTFHIVQEEKLAESVLYGPLKNLAYTVFPYLKEMLFWK